MEYLKEKIGQTDSNEIAGLNTNTNNNSNYPEAIMNEQKLE